MDRFDLILQKKNMTLEQFNSEKPLDLKAKLEEWFEIEEDIPFWQFAGITEEYYYEWISTSGGGNG